MYSESPPNNGSSSVGSLPVEGCITMVMSYHHAGTTMLAIRDTGKRGCEVLVRFQNM